MAKVMDGKMDVYEFGRKLLLTKDLDPVYVIVHHANLEDWELQRWLLAYFCFYHVGTASWIAHGDTGYWQRMETAAGSKDYPRSSERRHFRGGQAVRAVAWLKERGLEALWEPFNTAAKNNLTLPAEDVMEYVQTWKGFGPWISFKVADILERLGLVQVSFTTETVLYDSPRQAAEVLWNIERKTAAPGNTAGEWAIGRILGKLGNIDAPPRYERVINPQEAETVLCKWKSYLNGHYHVGKDIAEVKHGLLKFAKCPIAQQLLMGGKKGGLW